MPMPDDNASDYLPDSSISQYQKKNDETALTTSTDVPSTQETVKRMNDDIDKAY
jgi:hypothetical protein